MLNELALHGAHVATKSEDPIVDEFLDEVMPVVLLLRDIVIWADLDSGPMLRSIALAPRLRRVRYFNAVNGQTIATLTDTSNVAFTAYDVADALTWHVDHRNERWASSSIKALSADRLDLWIQFVPEPV
jgi:hypothetical protein